MNNAPVFDQPVVGNQQSTLNLDYWPTVVDIFEAKKFKETIIETLNYVNPQLVKKYGNGDQTAFAIPHGSVVISLKIEEGMYKISVPFLKLPQQNLLGLMRQVAELNFNVLILTQIVLRDGALYFEYQAPLELCEPFKLYDIFAEICSNADYYDDIFIEKFGASRFGEMKVEKFSSEQLAGFWEKFQAYLKEAITYVDYHESKRFYGFAWDAICIGLMKIDYYMAPQGYLRTEVEKCIAGLYGNNPLNERLTQAKTELQKMIEIERAKFDESMYLPQVFISSKLRADLQSVQNRLKENYDRAKNEIGSNDFIAATSSLMFAIYDLFYRYNIPTELQNTLKEGLVAASDKPWKDAAMALWQAVTKVMDLKAIS